jgi:predicted glycoside hydrolase/deacetylase ChbG (UPF0249 family)
MATDDAAPVHPLPPFELIVVGDDLGICSERDRGLLRCLTEGVATATSIMANGDSADSAFELLKAHGMLDCVGLHLNLTEGKPLSDPASIPTLLADGGVFRGKLEFREAWRLGELDAQEVRREGVAQLEWFQQRFGRPPFHVDGHQHCHVLPGQSVSSARGVTHLSLPGDTRTVPTAHVHGTSPPHAACLCCVPHLALVLRLL